MKRKIVLLTTFALVALLVAGGTMAWFTGTATAKNKFKAGTVEVKVVEEFDEEKAGNVNPGDCIKKKVKIENIGSKSAYVRVKLNSSWKKDGAAFNPTGKNPISFDDPGFWSPLCGKWFKWHDGWYYYRYRLTSENPLTTDLITKVCFDGKNMNNQYQGAEFALDIEVEAIQATHDAYLKNGWVPRLPIIGGPVLQSVEDTEDISYLDVIKSMEGYEGVTQGELNEILDPAE